MADEVPPALQARINELKDKVNSWLADMVGSYQTNADGDTFIRVGSVQVFVNVEPFGDDETVVSIYTFLLHDVPVTTELLEFVAFRGSWTRKFGTMKLMRDSENEGFATVVFDYNLLGDYLDKPELLAAISGVALGGDELDTEMHALFGGEMFFPDDD